jgi:glycosyltransferase involved in cell wall biosynthesis
MRVLWLDAFHAGSHRSVAQGYADHSRHVITVIGMDAAGGWRWRMRGAAVSFTQRIHERWGNQPLADNFDVLVVTDMLDLATWLGLNRDLVRGLRVVLYMHENQLVYPLPEGRTRDAAWAWINYTSMLAADAVLFNSAFHRESLLAALPQLPGKHHDYHELEAVASIGPKSTILYPGVDLRRFDGEQPVVQTGPLTILWNSRWDYDKQPVVFFAAMESLIDQGADIQLIVLGEYVDQGNQVFAGYRERLAPHTLHWGYVPDAASYRDWLVRADIVVSTAIQEFFGIAVIEAVYCGAVPVLPRRLAYPELVPPALHDMLLYEQDDDLVSHLACVLTHFHEIDRTVLRQWASQYDWQHVIGQYDEAITGCDGGTGQVDDGEKG